MIDTGLGKRLGLFVLCNEMPTFVKLPTIFNILQILGLLCDKIRFDRSSDLL
jgi:hypothetical protein